MKKQPLKKIKIIVFFSIIIWLFFAQSCMQFRVTDANAKTKFTKAGVNLETQTISINNFNLHYAKVGKDTFPTLFFIHGSPGSWNAFEKYMQDPDLLSKYRMISIDRPGFGYSQFEDAKNLTEQSEIISPLFKYINNNKPIYIIGHSLGGPLAVKINADNPSLFSGMVLLAASISPEEEAPENWRKIFHKTPFYYLLPGTFKPSNTEIIYLKKDLPLLAKQFSSITCPVWVLHGDKDKFVPVANADYAKRMLVNAKSVTVTILKGAPHFIPWQPWYKYVKDVLLQLN
jgi:pimeloyl-ACP methyl ester carboxylesterase